MYLIKNGATIIYKAVHTTVSTPFFAYWLYRIDIWTGSCVLNLVMVCARGRVLGTKIYIPSDFKIRAASVQRSNPKFSPAVISGITAQLNLVL